MNFLKRDFARDPARLEKAERELQRLAAVRRQKPNPQKLPSQVGRKLQQLKAYKYFQYQVDEQGQLQYQKNDELIREQGSGRPLSAAHRSRGGSMRQRASAGQLQELAGGRRCLLPTLRRIEKFIKTEEA